MSKGGGEEDSAIPANGGVNRRSRGEGRGEGGGGAIEALRNWSRQFALWREEEGTRERNRERGTYGGGQTHERTLGNRGRGGLCTAHGGTRGGYRIIGGYARPYTYVEGEEGNVL